MTCLSPWNLCELFQSRQWVGKDLCPLAPHCALSTSLGSRAFLAAVPDLGQWDGAGGRLGSDVSRARGPWRPAGPHQPLTGHAP